MPYYFTLPAAAQNTRLMITYVVSLSEKPLYFLLHASSQKKRKIFHSARLSSIFIGFVAKESPIYFVSYT